MAGVSPSHREPLTFAPRPLRRARPMPQRIPSHRPPRLPSARRRDESTRPSAAARGYCDRAHRAWRQAVLTRDAWACRACGRVCSDHREAHADHIVPISQGGERYSVANGQTLCASCHGRKTRAEQRDTRRAASVAPQPAAAGRARAEGRARRIVPPLRTENPGRSLSVSVRDTPSSRVAPR
jgi:5-methylcytosine-specific restriction protein A